MPELWCCQSTKDVEQTALNGSIPVHSKVRYFRWFQLLGTPKYKHISKCIKVPNFHVFSWNKYSKKFSPDAIFELKIHQNAFAAGSSPLAQLGSLQHYPELLALPPPYIWLRSSVVRTSVSDRWTFPGLRSICIGCVTTYVGTTSAIGQPTRPTQPFILPGSINE